MNVHVIIGLCAACVIFFILERLGLPTTLELHFKGDIKRESRWLAQYGQSVCTPVAALLVWQLDPAHGWQRPVTIVCAVLATSIACTLIKRTLGACGRDGRMRGSFWDRACGMRTIARVFRRHIVRARSR